MKPYLIPIIRAIMGEYFAPVIGLSYIIVKIILRHFIHKAIDHDYDFWGVLAWFSVDITLLSLSVCAASNVPAKHGLTHQESIFWYLAFIFFLVVAAFCYLFFIKRRNKLKKDETRNIRPYRDTRLALYLSTGWFIGFAWFWTILDALTV